MMPAGKRWLGAAAALTLLGFAGTVEIAAAQTADPAPVATSEQEVSPEDAQVALAYSLIDEGKHDDAILILDAVIKQFPRHGLARANRALAYGWTNRLDEAQRDLAAAEAIMPDAAIHHRIRAIIADRRSDEATVIAETTKALAKEPGDILALRFRANSYQRAKREAEAMADADAYVKAHSDDPGAYAFKANLLIRQQKRALAMEEADRLAKLFPGDAYAISSAARIFDRMGERDKAIALMTEAIIIDPENYYYHYLRAGMRRWDDLDGRQADLETSVALDPTNPGALTQLGLVEFKRRRWAQAADYFTKILDKEPKDHGLLAYRAMARLNAGNREAATSDFETAMGSASGSDDYSLICWLLGREGQALDWATQACDKAVEQKQQESSYRANRGVVRLRLGQLAGALEDFDAAVAADDRLAANHYGRAVVRRRMGDAAGSEADRTRALAIDPAVGEMFQEYGLSAEP